MANTLLPAWAPATAAYHSPYLPDPTPTWASCSSASSDVEPLAWALPLGSLVSIRAGELGLEEAGAPFGRACCRRECSSGPRTMASIIVPETPSHIYGSLADTEISSVCPPRCSCFESCRFLVPIATKNSFQNRGRTQLLQLLFLRHQLDDSALRSLSSGGLVK